MKVSATEEYGLRCILHVARRYDTDEPVTAQEVADAEGISVPYAQKLLRLLSQADIIDSRRGVGGGYVLSRSPAEISLGDVVRALDADFATAEMCERHTGDRDVCAHAPHCTIRPVWSYIEEFVVRTLEHVTLDVLLGDSQRVQGHLRALEERGAPALHCPVADVVLNT